MSTRELDPELADLELEPTKVDRSLCFEALFRVMFQVRLEQNIGCDQRCPKNVALYGHKLQVL